MAAGEPTTEDFRFDVFISYSRRDGGFARALQQALGNYSPPKDLPVPQRRLRVFRDESDFRGNEYGAALESMLGAAATLLVVCSPSSRESAYVGGEIARFAALRGKEHIVTVLLAGHPNNEAGPQAGQAFHDELVSRLPVPLAADYRGWSERRDRVNRDRFEGPWFKLLADIYGRYGVERTDVEGREKARQRRTRRVRGAVAGALVVVLASLTTWALFSRQQAIRQRNVAQSRFLATQAISGAHPSDVAMLLAAAAYRTLPTFEAWEALFVGLQRQPTLERFLHGLDATVRQIVISSGGGCAAAWTADDHTIVWDLRTGAKRSTVVGRAAPDGSCSSTVIALPTGGLESRTLEGDRRLWAADAGGAVTAWTPNFPGRLMAIAHAGGRLALRDPKDGRVQVEQTSTGSTWRYLRFSGDGQTLAAVDQNAMVHRFDAATLEPSAPAVRCGRSPEVFAVSPDLNWCAGGGPGELVVTDLTRTESNDIDLGTEWVLALDFSPDGRTLMTGVQGGRLRFRPVADLARDRERTRAADWSEHRSDVTAAAYAPDGRTIVSAARERSVVVWNPLATARLVSEVALTPQPAAVAASAGGPRLATGSSQGDVLVSADGTGRALESLATVGARVTVLAIRADGHVLAGTEDGRLLSVASHEGPRTILADRQPGVLRIRLNEDESRAVVTRSDQSLTMLDIATGAILATKPGERPGEAGTDGLSPGVDAAFEPGGVRVAAIQGQQSFIWKVQPDSEAVVPLPFRPTSYFTSVAFAPLGGPIALGTGMYEEEIMLIDPSRTEKEVARLASHNDGRIAVTALAFSPDRRLLFSGLFDGTTTVWDVAGRRRIGQIHRAAGTIVDLQPAKDGTALTAVTDRGIVQRWNLDPSAWMAMACAVANRTLTAEEQVRFLDASRGADVCAP